MAFWGVEVKPWKPVTYSCEKKSRGRLRISQATLGIGSPVQKSLVQCKVGNRSPVLLCVLLPNQTESCHLDLEFEESDDVIFSVIGPRGVYLTGYYVCKTHQPSPQSDSESYGVDIENSHTEESNRSGEDDEYEDSFIDDDELQVCTPSPVSSSMVGVETTPESSNRKKKKGHGKRLKKRSQVVESDDDELQVCTPSPVSSSKVGDEITPESSNRKKKKGQGKQLKKRSHVVESDDDDNSRKSEDEDGYLLSIFKSKKDVKTDFTSHVEITAQATVETGKKLNNNGVCSRKSEENIDLVNIDGKSERAKTRKKRKERCEEDGKTQTLEVHIEKDHSIPISDKKPEVDASTNKEISDAGSLPLESGSGNCKRSKKRRKEVQLEGTDEKYHNDSKMNDMAAEKMDQLANASQQPEKKIKKKKKKKTQGEGGLVSGSNQENTLSKEKPVQKKTLSNGLIIEEVASGPPDGKVAAPGKKVKIYYTAMLKENGHVFYSNVGKDACKFRLGNEGKNNDVWNFGINGNEGKNNDVWNFGIDGMHVGDKRRLIIPPSMCFEKHGAAENVPPNSWLVYDVELAGVHK